MKVEHRLYLKLAKMLALLLAVVVVGLYSAATLSARHVARSNVSLAHEDAARALAEGVPPQGLTQFWRIGLSRGFVVLTDRANHIVSAPEGHPLRAGDVWQGAPKGYDDSTSEADGYVIHVLMPARKAYFELVCLFVVLGVVLAITLCAAACFVARAVTRYVRERDLRDHAEAMKLATDIQLSAMPRTFPPYPEMKEFDVYATMKPAKEVGGDFYDFYFTRPGRLLFMVADVSGKGVPAALFMMRAKSLLKGFAQTGISLAEAVKRTNESLCEGNAATVFVTAWVGELNLRTGTVTYVNAGHNRPIHRKADGAAYVQDAPCLFLGALPGVDYVSYQLKLAPGDSLYLYTDGITEQVNEQMELFGESRLLEDVRTTKLRQKMLLERIARAVHLHAGKAEQTDDCTQLEIVWRGAPVRTSHDYAPTMEGLAQAAADLEAALEGVAFEPKMLLLTAADEVFMNIIRHSEATTWSLSVERFSHPEEVRLTFSDDGKKFNPLEVQAPDTSIAIEERPVGGLGIFIVKKTMSPVTYVYREGWNVLTLGKVLEPESKIEAPTAAGPEKVPLAARIIRRRS